MQTPLNKVCETQSNGKIYERRVFKDGKLMEEILNYESGSTRIHVKDPANKRDSVVATIEQFWPSGLPQQKSIYYFDRTGRRCEKYMDFHLNGKLRFVNFNAFVRQSEISSYDVQYYPPHMIDYDGYSTLRVPFGTALVYDGEGNLISKTNHQLILTRSFEYNSKHGLFEEYHYNGKLKTKGYYKDGDPDGDWLIYNFLGQKIEEQHFKRNMKIGTWNGWHDNGKPRFESTYDTLSNFPFTANTKEWNEAGQLIHERQIDRNGVGFEKRWTDKGVLILQLGLVNNSKELGFEKNWYPNGQLKSFLNNSRNADTTYVSFFENGKMEEIHLKYFHDSTTRIIHKKFNSAEKLISEIEKSTSNKEQIFDFKSYWGNGNVMQKVYEINKLRTEETFYKNGKTATVKHFVAGKLSGSYLDFDSLGNKLISYNYLENMRHGLCQRFDKSGKIIFSKFYDKGCPMKMDTDLESKKRHWEELKKEEKEQFRSFIYYNWQQFDSPKDTLLFYSQKQIDSIASYYMYLHDAWSKYASFPFPTNQITSQVISFRLPSIYLMGIDKGDTSNKYVKEIVTAFNKNGWKISNLKSESGYHNWNFETNGLYTHKFIQTHFPLLQSFIYILPQTKNVEPLENQYIKTRHSRPISLVAFSNCIKMATCNSYEKSFQFLIYPDGEMDLLNGVNWENLKDINDFSRELPYD